MHTYPNKYSGYYKATKKSNIKIQYSSYFQEIGKGLQLGRGAQGLELFHTSTSPGGQRLHEICFIIQ